LVNQLRQVALRATQWAQATCGTIQLRLSKIGALVRITVRRVRIHLSRVYPLADLFALVAGRRTVLNERGVSGAVLGVQAGMTCVAARRCGRGRRMIDGAKKSRRTLQKAGKEA
jgi:hypothetical protein